MPSDGIIEMSASDQGVKTFSKGLRLNKPGNFTVNMSILNDTVSGSTTIIVN